MPQDTHLDRKRFPFPTVLSLEPLIRFWEGDTVGANRLQSLVSDNIRDKLNRAPELREAIREVSVLEQHRELVETLMTAVIPPALWDDIALAVNFPYELRSFYSTPFFDQLALIKNGEFTHGTNLTDQNFLWGKTVCAYNAILRKFYGATMSFEYPLRTTVPDPKTGLDRHYKISLDPRFIEIKPTRKLPELDEKQRKYLLANSTNLEVLSTLIPPDRFEFHGFTLLHAVDVTDEEVFSSLKAQLLEKDTLLSDQKMHRLQDQIRVLLRAPDALLGVSALQGDIRFFQNIGRKIGSNFVLEDQCRYGCSDTEGSIYERALKAGELVIMEDLTTHGSRTRIEDEILDHGLRNMIVAPLYDEDELVGALELGSPNPGDLNGINAIKLGEVIPLFAMAVKRSLDELNVQIQAVIKAQCTAIHPAVEWRFRRAALECLQNATAGRSPEMAPVVLEGVYPLYGLSDVRDSSAHRNHATQADLVEHLEMAREIVRQAGVVKPLPILDQIALRIGKRIESIQSGLNSGDEERTTEFLKHEIHPVFDHLRELAPDLDAKVRAYEAAMDPTRGSLYRRRKEFQDSIASLNRSVSALLEEQQREAQAMFPHYFEKFVTDGVDHSMYIGASIVEDGRFHPIYLRNLRLWQLMLLSTVAREAERIGPNLPVPLQMTHLILVQDTPLSLRFSQDEKKFTVEGAYDVRYEIIKKRIDKALIKGTGERLTQPGKVAIVHSQQSEAQEYRAYIEWMQSQGYLMDDFEEVELQDLQGVQGLKALRVSVNISAAGLEQSTLSKTLKENTLALAG